MSNETFQIIITVAVALAVLSMIVQGLVAIAMYRSARRMMTALAPSVARLKSILAVEKETIRRLEMVVDKALLFADIAERIFPRFSALAERSVDVAGHATFLKAQAAELGRSVQLIETATHFMGVELHPRIQAVKSETAALVRSTREQSRRVVRVFRDAISHSL